MKKFYEQSFLKFVKWVSYKYKFRMQIVIQGNNPCLPPIDNFKISRQYNHLKDFCYENGLGYWLDTQNNFYLADTEDKAKKLVFPIALYINYLKENNFTPNLSITSKFIKNVYKGNEEEKYHAFVLINLYFQFLSFSKLYDYRVYSGRKFTGGYIRGKFGSKCCLCGETMPNINEENIHYSPFKGSTNYFQAHHIVPISKDGKDEISNIILLCPNCHTKIHLGAFDISIDDLIKISKERRNSVKSEKSENTKEANTENNIKKVIIQKEEPIKKVVKTTEKKKKEEVDPDMKMFLDYLNSSLPEKGKNQSHEYFKEKNNIIEEDFNNYYEEDDIEDNSYYDFEEEEDENIDFDNIDFSMLQGHGNSIKINKKI